MIRIKKLGNGIYFQIKLEVYHKIKAHALSHATGNLGWGKNVLIIVWEERIYWLYLYHPIAETLYYGLLTPACGSWMSQGIVRSSLSVVIF